jgi:hypothetical protein
MKTVIILTLALAATPPWQSQRHRLTTGGNRSLRHRRGTTRQDCLIHFPIGEALESTELMRSALACFRAVLTALAADGTAIKRNGKTFRMSLGSIASGAIKLDPDADATQGLCVGEGLETCLSGRQMGLRRGSRFMNTSRRHEPGVARGHSEIAVALGCRPRSGWSARLGRDQPSPSPALALEVESSCRRLRPKNRGPDQRAPVISRATTERER